MEARLSTSKATLPPVLRASTQHEWAEREVREASDFSKESQRSLTLLHLTLEVELAHLYEVGSSMSTHRSP